MISNLTIHPLVYDPSFTGFTRDEPLSSIVRKMFIESWNPSFSFEQYYKRCAPSVCKYTTTAQRKDFFGIMLILISMIGGLAIALRIATPILVNTVLDYFKPKSRRTSQRLPLFVRAKKMIKMLSKAVFNLNIFPSGAFGNGIDRDYCETARPMVYSRLRCSSGNGCDYSHFTHTGFSWNYYKNSWKAIFRYLHGFNSASYRYASMSLLSRFFSVQWICSCWRSISSSE